MPPSERSCRLAARILEPDAATVADAAAAVRAAHERLRHEMSKVIGEAGFSAMFTRCVRKTRDAQPLFAQVVTGDASEHFLDRVWSGLARLPSTAAVRAVGVELLARYFELMATLVGDDLTLRLLRNIWPEIANGDLGPRETS